MMGQQKESMRALPVVKGRFRFSLQSQFLFQVKERDAQTDEKLDVKNTLNFKLQEPDKETWPLTKSV